MAATIEFRSYHGPLGQTTDGNVLSTTIRFKAADNDTVDTTDPLLIPASGTICSFVKQLRFYAVTTPSNFINNLKFWSDGSNGYGTGVALNAKTFATLTGTATSGTPTTLTKTGASFGTLGGYVLEITAGTNSGQSRRISSNTSTVITVATAFPVALDATSQYAVRYLDPVQQAQTALSGAVDAFSLTSGAPLALGGSINNPSTGAFGDYLQLQLAVASTSSQGTTANETFTVSYDEA